MSVVRRVIKVKNLPEKYQEPPTLYGRITCPKDMRASDSVMRSPLVIDPRRDYSDLKSDITPYLKIGQELLRNAMILMQTEKEKAKMVESDLFNKGIELGNVSLEYLVDGTLSRFLKDGHWKQGEKTLGNYDSPSIYIADKCVTDGRIGIRWEDARYPNEKTKDGKSWERVIRLNLEISEGVEKWGLHARTEYESSDDEEVDEVLEKILSEIPVEKVESWMGWGWKKYVFKTC